MPGGTILSIGGRHYIFNEAGDRAKDVLWIESSSDLEKGVIGRNASYIKGRKREIKEVVKSDNVVKNGVDQKIYLLKGMDEKMSTATLGHEVFVHADESADMLTDIENGSLRGENSVIRAIQNIGSKAIEDHNRLGENTVIKYKNFMQELSRIFNDKYYNTEYEKDVETTYINGEWYGPYTTYYASNGNVKIRAFCINGIWDGEFISYYENGNIEYITHFKNGLYNGLFYQYSEDGELCQKILYENDKIKEILFDNHEFPVPFPLEDN